MTCLDKLSKRFMVERMTEEKTKKAILVVDDVAANLELIAVNLIQEGYRIITCESGFAALDMINLEKPGLVLLDIMMPKMDGIETLKRIKAIDPNIPVAMVTSVWDETEANKAMEAGAFEYITKPVDFDYLKLAVLIKMLPNE